MQEFVALSCFCQRQKLCSIPMKNSEVEKLKAWFLSQRRDLPWREDPSPYAVWVSEVMLQQTQVSVVIPYFLRWMEKFPTIEALANASIEEVVKEWEGLGYYSRARNLHEGARFVLKNYSGILPSTEKQLKEIKGLGDYTVGAILSFAFHQRAAAVDGNVLRVLARYYCLEDDICKSKTVKEIRERAQALLPKSEPWLVSEALIELGATVCSRTPKCHACPVNSSCMAFAQGKAAELPVKSARQATTSLYRAVAVIACDGHFLVGKGESGKVMAGLFEFPYVELNAADVDVEAHGSWLKKEMKLSADWLKALPEVRHSFTRYRALLMPQLYSVKKRKEVDGFEWHSLESLKKLPFSSGHRRILAELIG